VLANIVCYVYAFSMKFFYIYYKYERRGRFVLENEEEKWKEVTPLMISDEEEFDGKFKVHRQEWHSDELNSFLQTLDTRANVSERVSGHPRKERIDGTPIKCLIQHAMRVAAGWW